MKYKEALAAAILDVKLGFERHLIVSSHGEELTKLAEEEVYAPIIYFDKIFLEFKSKYLSADRILDIRQNEFGGDDIVIIFYDKYNKSPPLDIKEYKGFHIEMLGVMGLLHTHEFIYDQYVLNDPGTWEQEDVPFSQFYKKFSKMIANYELSKL